MHSFPSPVLCLYSNLKSNQRDRTVARLRAGRYQVPNPVGVRMLSLFEINLPFIPKVITSHPSTFNNK